MLFISCKHDVTENKKNLSDETVTSRSQDNFLYFGRRGFGANGVWKDILDFSLACQSAMVSHQSNTLVSSPRYGSAYNMDAMTPSGTVRSLVL